MVAPQRFFSSLASSRRGDSNPIPDATGSAEVARSCATGRPSLRLPSCSACAHVELGALASPLPALVSLRTLRIFKIMQEFTPSRCFPAVVFFAIIFAPCPLFGDVSAFSHSFFFRQSNVRLNYFQTNSTFPPNRSSLPILWISVPWPFSHCMAVCDGVPRISAFQHRILSFFDHFTHDSTPPP